MPLANPAFQRTLTDRLLKLNYHALLQIVAVLLGRMGYEDVQVQSRTGYVGRNCSGGVDIVAYRPVPGGRRLVVVQVKQYAPERAVFKRTLDELRGVCLRSSAAEALLITTGTFSNTISPTGFAAAPIAPVQLVDGEELAELLSLYRVGVMRSQSSGARGFVTFHLDELFFAEMEAAFPGVARPLPGTRQLVGIVVSVTPRKRRA